MRTFTIGFNEEGNSTKRSLPRKWRSASAQDHNEMYVTPKDALDVIPNIPHMFRRAVLGLLTDPHLSPLSKMARIKHVTVSLSGDAGDELHHWGLFMGHKVGIESNRCPRLFAKVSQPA